MAVVINAGHQKRESDDGLRSKRRRDRLQKSVEEYEDVDEDEDNWEKKNGRNGLRTRRIFWRKLVVGWAKKEGDLAW